MLILLFGCRFHGFVFCGNQWYSGLMMVADDCYEIWHFKIKGNLILWHKLTIIDCLGSVFYPPQQAKKPILFIFEKKKKNEEEKTIERNPFDQDSYHHSIKNAHPVCIS